jgi:hypothetical protein
MTASVELFFENNNASSSSMMWQRVHNVEGIKFQHRIGLQHKRMMELTTEKPRCCCFPRSVVVPRECAQTQNRGNDEVMTNEDEIKIGSKQADGSSKSTAAERLSLRVQSVLEEHPVTACGCCVALTIGATYTSCAALGCCSACGHCASSAFTSTSAFLAANTYPGCQGDTGICGVVGCAFCCRGPCQCFWGQPLEGMVRD